MLLKSNKAFSLLEVIISVAILSTAIVFIFRAFTMVLASVRFSQNITLACFLAEDKLWRLENKFPLTDTSQEETLRNIKFEYNHELTKTDTPELKQLKFTVSWIEKRENPYAIEFFTYLYEKE